MSSSLHSRSATALTGATDLTDVTGPLSEHGFREAFYNLCRRYREHRAEQLLNRLLDRHCPNIIELVDNIDEALGADAESQSGDFFSSLLDVLKAGLETKTDLEVIVDLFDGHDIEDSDALYLDDDALHFLRRPDVCEPLQDIAKEILECHTVMIQHFKEYGAVERNNRPEQVVSRYTEAASRIEGYTKSWLEQLDKVKRAEDERKRRESMSISSYQNSINGHPVSSPSLVINLEHSRYLGRGRIGQVDAVRIFGGSEEIAQKTIYCGNVELFRKMDVDVKEEVAKMANLRHHHIAQIVFGPIPDPVHFTFRIYMRPAGQCDLGTFLPQFTDKYDNWFGCLVSALQHSHSCGIIHQDIKPSNIIISGNEPFLVDFGSARDFSASGVSMLTDDNIRGTPNYLAPEDNPGQSRNRKADIFSLGCVFAEMFTIRQKKQRQDLDQVRNSASFGIDFPYAFRHNIDSVRNFLKDLDNNSSDVEDETDDKKDLIINMLNADPKRRMSTNQLLRELRRLNMTCERCSAID